MSKINELTPEQLSMIPKVRDEYLNNFFSGKRINKDALIPKIHCLYEFCGLKKPMVIVVDSPMSAQIAVNMLNMGGHVWDQVWYQVRAQVEDIKLQYYATSSYCNYSDYGWLSFYYFFEKIGVKYQKDTLQNFHNINDIVMSGVFDMIQLDGLCVISQLPTSVQRDELRRLHSGDSPAITFADGYSQYYWHGVSVPGEWITDRSSITKETFLKEENAERRRCLQEILGGDLFSLLDMVEVDKDDDAGLPIVLYKSKTPDIITNEHIYYLMVQCHSTNRIYYLCVPPSKNVWEAKAFTFHNQKIEIRHGDVGLLNINKEFNKPIYQS